jgi:hypothetical protein
MKKQILFLLLLLFTLIQNKTFAQKCLTGNCSSGFGKYEYADGTIYVGEHDDDLKEGYGIMTFKSGNKYYGDFKKGNYNGFGVFKHTNGDWYAGDFKDGKYDGEGIYTFKDGKIQNGLWEKGDFKGKISFYGAPADSVGCLNGTCQDGYGMKYLSNGDHYFGYFKNGKRDGYGVYYYSSGDRYYGEWKEDAQTGYGIYYFTTGEKYLGYWASIKREGWGINYNPIKETKEIGIWKNDEFETDISDLAKGCIDGECKDGKGSYLYNNGYYYGDFKNSYRDGEGVYMFNSGEIYIGGFKQNKFDGKGTFYWSNGSKYDGGWLSQQRHGKGVYFYNDGLIDDGNFEFNKFIGNRVISNVNTAFNNKINVATNSTNTNSNTSNANLKIKTFGASTFTATNFPGEKRLALVIGNSNYTGEGLNKLTNPVNDATAMTSNLLKLGFDVISITDGTLDQMRDALRSFGSRLKSYHVGLFFYAGHGIQIDGENYILPTNAKVLEKQDVRYECLSMTTIIKKMEEGATQMNIVLLDACRNNPFEKSWDRGNALLGLSPLEAPVGTFIGYATAPGKTASDGVVGGNNGVYTSQIINFIAQPNLTIEQVFKRVRVEVMNKTNNKQLPWDANSTVKDFYFVKSK